MPNTRFALTTVVLVPRDLFQRVRRMEILPGIVVREARYAAHSAIGQHAHEWAFLAFVVHGFVNETSNGASEMRSAGALRILPAGVSHANAYGAPGARCMVAEIHDLAARELGERGVRLDEPASFESGTPASWLARRMYAEYRLGDCLTPLAVDGIMRELFVATSRDRIAASRKQAPPAWLAAVRDRLHDEFPLVPSLRELAAGAGVHPSHLVRTFRREYRHAPAEYAAHLRIERACGLLVASAEPISRIALTVGFSDQAHFTRRFRAITGTTPARYRALMERERAGSERG